MGPVRFGTRFGELRLELIDKIPQTVFIACRGRLVEEVVDHVALHGRKWRIDKVEDAKLPGTGQVLLVLTDPIGYRLPWAR